MKVFDHVLKEINLVGYKKERCDGKRSLCYYKNTKTSVKIDGK